jgi:hypothetical protein
MEYGRQSTGDQPYCDRIAKPCSPAEAASVPAKPGVPFHRRVNHSMTHSLYINGPNGYGIEVLYELAREVWEGDIDAALNYAERLPTEGAAALTADDSPPKLLLQIPPLSKGGFSRQASMPVCRRHAWWFSNTPTAQPHRWRRSAHH